MTHRSRDLIAAILAGILIAGAAALVVQPAMAGVGVIAPTASQGVSFEPTITNF